MTNIAQINPNRNAALKICNDVSDIVEEIDGVWETIILLDEKLEAPEYHDEEMLRRYANCRVLLANLVTKNREKLIEFLDQRRAAERSGAVA